MCVLRFPWGSRCLQCGNAAPDHLGHVMSMVLWQCIFVLQSPNERPAECLLCCAGFFNFWCHSSHVEHRGSSQGSSLLLTSWRLHGCSWLEKGPVKKREQIEDLRTQGWKENIPSHLFSLPLLRGPPDSSQYIQRCIIFWISRQHIPFLDHCHWEKIMESVKPKSASLYFQCFGLR